MNQCLNPDHLLGEARTSVTFCSVFCAVSIAIVGKLIARCNICAVVIPFLLLCITIISLLYSALFYANASGSLSRRGRKDVAEKALVWGNSVSEYFGVYPLVCAIPLVAWAVTEKMLITIYSMHLPFSIIVCMIDLLGFFFYQKSECALLSRVDPRLWVVITITGWLVVLVLALFFLVVSHNSLDYVVVVLFLFTCLICCILGIKKGSIKRASTAI